MEIEVSQSLFSFSWFFSLFAVLFCTQDTSTYHNDLFSTLCHSLRSGSFFTTHFQSSTNVSSWPFFFSVCRIMAARNMYFKASLFVSSDRSWPPTSPTRCSLAPSVSTPPRISVLLFSVSRSKNTCGHLWGGSCCGRVHPDLPARRCLSREYKVKNNPPEHSPTHLGWNSFPPLRCSGLMLLVASVAPTARRRLQK